MKKIIITAVIVSLVFIMFQSNGSYAYRNINNNYYVHQEVPPSQLDESINNMKSYLAKHNDITPKFYSEPNDSNSQITFPVIMKPYEIKYLYVKKYQYLQYKTFCFGKTAAKNINVKVGAEYTIDNKSFQTFDNVSQKGGSFDFHYSLNVIAKNRYKYRSAAIQLFNNSSMPVLIDKPHNAYLPEVMENSSVLTQNSIYTPVIVDNASLIKIGSNVVKHSFPENRIDIGHAVINGIDNNANTYIKYSLNIPPGSKVINASLNMSNVQSTCSIIYQIENVLIPWNSSTINWNNQPSGIFIDDCT